MKKKLEIWRVKCSKKSKKSIKRSIKSTAVWTISKTKIQKWTNDLGRFYIKDIWTIRSHESGNFSVGLTIRGRFHRRSMFDPHIKRNSKALAYEKQNTIRAISAIESKISNPIQTVQNKLDSFEQMVMDELNKNDENDKLCVENILYLNRTLVDQSSGRDTNQRTSQPLVPPRTVHFVPESFTLD